MVSEEAEGGIGDSGRTPPGVSMGGATAEPAPCLPELVVTAPWRSAVGVPARPSRTPVRPLLIKGLFLIEVYLVVAV